MTAATPGDDRARRAEALLRSGGIPGAEVSVAGLAGEIAAVRAPLPAAHRLRALAPAIRDLGFRYVALDLGEAGAEEEGT